MGKAGVVTPVSVIEARILKAIKSKIAKEGVPPKLESTGIELYDKIAEILKRAILSSDALNSLMGGKLRADFGIDDNLVSLVPGILIDLFEIHYEITTETTDPKTVLSVIFTIRARLEEDPYTQSAITRAQYVSPKSGKLINWLRWLLFSGGETINDSYEVKLLPGIGRSHMAVMIHRGFFEVDPEFQGREGSNFVSRAIESVVPEIESLIRSYASGV